MKKVKLNTARLHLMKETIASLSNAESRQILGGSYQTAGECSNGCGSTYTLNYNSCACTGDCPTATCASDCNNCVGSGYGAGCTATAGCNTNGCQPFSTYC